MRKLTAGVLASLIYLLSISELNADAFEEMQKTVLSDAASATVVISDDVGDRCWPNPDGTKAVIEEKLLSAGIPVSEIGDVFIKFSAIGGAARLLSDRQIGCNVAWTYNFYYFAPTETPNSASTIDGVIVFGNNGGIIATGDNSAQNSLRDKAADMATRFVVLWLKARQK